MTTSQLSRSLTPAHVAVVDDEPYIRAIIRRVLERDGHRVVDFESPAEALEYLRGARVEMVLSDLCLPGMDGIDFLREVHRIDPRVSMALLTGEPGVESAVAGVNLGLTAYLAKPVVPNDVVDVVRRGVEATRERARVQRALTVYEASLTTDMDELQRAFERTVPGLWIAFQPIVNQSTATVIGYEGLMRSVDKDLPHPGAVLEAAERLERTQELGRHLRALTARTFLAAEPDDGVRLFVNLHPRDLLDPDLYDAESELAAIAERVVLEITERASLSGLKDLDERLGRLSALGFRIAIDDIGCGYSGLSAFASLEPDIVKIDMSLVRDIDTSHRKRCVVAAINRLAWQLSCEVVVEGVETPAELETLRELGCDLMQGYYFARPDRGLPEVDPALYGPPSHLAAVG